MGNTTVSPTREQLFGGGGGQQSETRQKSRANCAAAEIESRAPN